MRATQGKQRGVSRTAVVITGNLGAATGRPQRNARIGVGAECRGDGQRAARINKPEPDILNIGATATGVYPRVGRIEVAGGQGHAIDRNECGISTIVIGRLGPQRGRYTAACE